MSFSFHNLDMPPGMTEVRETCDWEVTWGPWEINRAFVIPAIIDGTSRDTGNAVPENIRNGMLMGYIKTGPNVDKWRPWDPAATDGSETACAVLLHSVQTQNEQGDTDRWFGWILVKGQIKHERLLINGEAEPGIDGHALESQLRASMEQCGFLFDDAWVGEVVPTFAFTIGFTEGFEA